MCANMKNQLVDAAERVESGLNYSKLSTLIENKSPLCSNSMLAS